MSCFYFSLTTHFTILVFWIENVVTEIWSAYARHRQWWIQLYEHLNAHYICVNRAIKLSAVLHMQNVCMTYYRLIAENLIAHLITVYINIIIITDQHMLNMNLICTYIRMLIINIIKSEFRVTACVQYMLCINKAFKKQ